MESLTNGVSSVAQSPSLIEDELIGWIETAVDKLPNGELLNARLQTVSNGCELVNFLHRFVIFNDALAARVPYLAGLIHLTPSLFVEPGPETPFNRVRNGLIAAYVAEAASDEYHMHPDSNMVHQYLSQVFFGAVLDYFQSDLRQQIVIRELPYSLQAVIAEARNKFFDLRSEENVLSALGYHIALELFANQEFNQVDRWLKADYPELVQSMEARRGSQPNAYFWLATHTVVEVRHYRAGLEAVKLAMRYCTLPDSAASVSRCVKQGFDAFVDMQRRFYDGILQDYA